MAKIQNTDNTKRRQRCGATELSFIAGRMQNGTAPVEDSLAVSYKAKHCLSYDPANVLFGIYTNGLMNSYS